MLLTIAIILQLFSQPQLGMYSRVKGSGYPFINSKGVVDTAVVKTQAKWDIVVLDPEPLTNFKPEVLSLLRKYNPKIFLECYLTLWYWKNPYPSYGDTTNTLYWKIWQAVRNTRGQMYLKNGKEVNYVNMADLNTVQAVAESTLNCTLNSGLWDGVFVDGTCNGFGIYRDGDTLDLARMGYDSEREFQAKWRIGIGYYAELIREKVLFIVGNCGIGTEHEYFNGTMRENFPYQNIYWQCRNFECGWEDNILGHHTNVEMSGYLADDTLYQYHQQNWINTLPAYGDSMSSENRRIVRFGLGTACLGNGIHTVGKDGDGKGYTPWWYPEYAVNLSTGIASSDPYYKNWLGYAISKAYKVAPTVWRRDYRNGLVVVNYGSKQQIINFGKFYKRIRANAAGYDGRSTQRVIIPSHDAIFLLNN